MQFSTSERITYISLEETSALNLTLLKTAFSTTSLLLSTTLSTTSLLQIKQGIRDEEFKIRSLLLSWISMLHHKHEHAFPKR